MSITLEKTFCFTCLSTTRNLYPIEDSRFFACLTTLKLAEASKFRLCWECNAFMKKAKLFRKKALTAQLLMQKKCRNVKPLTSLISHKLNHTLAINCHSMDVEQPLNTLELEHSIKKEIVEDEMSEQNEYEQMDSVNVFDSMIEIVVEPDIIIKCEDNPLETAMKDNTPIVEWNDTPGENHLVSPNRIQNLLMPPFTESFVPTDESLPMKYETNDALELLEVKKNYTLRVMTDEKMIEERNKRLKDAKFNKIKLFCGKCALVFKSKLNYNIHMKKHNVLTGDYVCKICEMRFESEELMTIHTNKHYRIVTCNICSDEFSTLGSFKTHFDKHHDEELTECNICQTKDMPKNLLKVHQRIHEKKECRTCNKLIPKVNLRYHMRSHAPKINLECNICHKMYDGPVKLNKHRKVAHPTSKAVDAYCVECNIQFKSVENYKVHLESSSKHVKEEIKCLLCDSIFSCNNKLKAHVKIVHGNKVTCTECQQSFSCNSRLQDHVEKVHEMCEKPRNKVCDICGKGFKTHQVLQQHMHSHMNIRPYTCAVCDATFSYQSALFTHTRLIHTKVPRPKQKKKK